MKDKFRGLAMRMLGMPAGDWKANIALQQAGHLTMGRRTYGEPHIATFPIPDGQWVAGDVHIGAFCSIADNVTIFTGGEHRPEWTTTYPIRIEYQLPGAGHDGQPRTRGDVHIGNDVWIGSGATIMSGVSIGDGAVIGAHAVVRKDVRPYAIVVGNPAVEVRRRFDDATVERVHALQWWTWPDEEIAARVDQLCAPPSSWLPLEHIPTALVAAGLGSS